MKKILKVFLVILAFIVPVIIAFTLDIRESKKESNTTTKLPEQSSLSSVYKYFDDQSGIDIRIGDQAMGTYALQIYSTTDGGNTWKLQTQNSDGYIAVNIDAKYLFISTDIGFIEDPSKSGDSSDLLMTTDGGKTFKKIDIVSNDILETFTNGNNIKKNEVFDSYTLPTLENNVLKLNIYQGSDGDYKGGKGFLKYESYDFGKTWTYISYSNN